MPKMTVNFFRMIYFRKDAPATPLESYTFKTKDLKLFSFIYLQKKGGGGTHASESGNTSLPGSVVACQLRKAGLATRLSLYS